MQPWALSLPDKELCLREALAVCTPPAPEPSPKAAHELEGPYTTMDEGTAQLLPPGPKDGGQTLTLVGGGPSDLLEVPKGL